MQVNGKESRRERYVPTQGQGGDTVSLDWDLAYVPQGPRKDSISPEAHARRAHFLEDTGSPTDSIRAAVGKCYQKSRP